MDSSKPGVIQLDLHRTRSKEVGIVKAGTGRTLNPNLFKDLSDCWSAIQTVLESGTACEPHNRVYLPVEFNDGELKLEYAPASVMRTYKIDPTLLHKSAGTEVAPFTVTLDLNRVLRLTPTPEDITAIQAYYFKLEACLDPGDAEGSDVLDFIDVIEDIKDLRKSTKRTLPVNQLRFSNHRLVRSEGVNKMLPGFSLTASQEDGFQIDISQGTLERPKGFFGLAQDHPWTMNGHQELPSRVELNSNQVSHFTERAIQILKRRFQALRKT